MAISVVNKTNANTLTVTIPATTAGNCLIVCVASFYSGTPPAISGVTLGGAADNFAQLIAPVNNTNSAALMWADPNCAGGQTSVVISGTNLSVIAGAGAVEVYEASGLASTIAAMLDKSSTGSNASSGAWSSGTTGTTSQAAELWVGMVEAPGGGVVGPGLPWVNDHDTHTEALFGTQVTSSAGAAVYNGTVTPGSWAAIVVTLQSPASAVPTALPLNLDAEGIFQDSAQYEGPPLGSGYIR